MLKHIFLTVLLCSAVNIHADAQVTYKIKADSVKIAKDTGNAELIIENSTKNVDGFLYNKGNGRTEFRSLSGAGTSWQTGGNTGVTGSHFVGTADTNKLVLKTNSLQRASFTGDGSFVMGPNDTARRSLFRFFPNGDFLINSVNRNYSSVVESDGGIRYHRRLGYLEIGGTTNVIDTTVSETMFETSHTSALIANNDDASSFAGQIKSSLISAYTVSLQPGKMIYHSTFVGGGHFTYDNIAHSLLGGVYHFYYKALNYSTVLGNGQYMYQSDDNGFWNGFNNRNEAATQSSMVGGLVNTIGSTAQFTAGNFNYNRSFAATALGNGNVNFTSIPFNGWTGSLSSITIQPGDILFSVGNSSTRKAQLRSNAMTVLYNGRTQINTTGFSDSLSQAAAKPKAALEVVSKNSGVLLPKLTTGQRDSIASGDLYTGLLLFNTTANRYEYYNGTAWAGLGDNSASGSLGSLKDSALVKWDLALGSTKTVKLSGNRTLSITNLQSGSEGKLIIMQDSTGMRKLTLPANSYVNNEGNGVLPLSQVAGAIDVVSFLYDGTNFYWTLLPELTREARTAQFNFNEVAQFVPGWNDVTGNPHLAVITATDWRTGIGVSSIATGKWGSFGSRTANNALGEPTANPSFVLEPRVIRSLWFSTTYTYSNSSSCNLEINGLQAGARYNIEILSSRDNVDVIPSTRYERLVCVDNGGEQFLEDVDVLANTTKLITFYNKAPNGSGKILLFIGKKNPADANHAFGYINALRITKL